MTKNVNLASLNWGQRLAVIDSAKVTDEQASNVLGVPVSDIETARKRVKQPTTFDTAPFQSQFSKVNLEKSTEVDEPKKRGRAGTKVMNALISVTGTPVPVEEFSKLHGVSINVLPQVKRFTTYPDKHENAGEPLPAFVGRNIKVSKKNGVRSIWDESLV